MFSGPKQRSKRISIGTATRGLRQCRCCGSKTRESSSTGIFGGTSTQPMIQRVNPVRPTVGQFGARKAVNPSQLQRCNRRYKPGHFDVRSPLRVDTWLARKKFPSLLTGVRDLFSADVAALCAGPTCAVGGAETEKDYVMNDHIESVLSALWATKRALEDAFSAFRHRLPYWWCCRPDWRAINECESWWK